MAHSGQAKTDKAGQGHPMGTRAITDNEPADRIRELDDPEFFSYWSELRHRIALGGKSVPPDMKREYAVVSAEYRRRIDSDPES
jgi:hypothetical protein